MKLLLRWIILTGAVLAASYLCKLMGLNFEAHAADTAGFFRLMIGTAILALLNATLGTVLKILTLPLNCLTFGLFSLVVNAFVLIIAASLNFGFRFTSTGGSQFLSALVASLLIAVVAGLLNGMFAPDEERPNRDSRT